MTDGVPHDQRDWRRIALYLVAIGMMSVSISGQVQSIAPQLGWFLAVVFAVTNDVGAILALDIALSASTTAIKGWAWVAILLAAGTGGALNTHHASVPPPPPGTNPIPQPLPAGFPYLVGLEPVILVLVLSHLIGLVVAARRQPAAAGDRQPVASQPVASRAASQPVVARVGDRQQTAILAKQPVPRDRQPTPAPGRQLDRQPAVERTAPQPARRPERPPTPVPARPARGLTAVPEPRLAWMTDDLIEAVVTARRADATYGRGQIVADHKIGSGQARSLLRYINKNGLLRDSA